MIFPEKLDVVVVGGGPIGGITAKGLASKGMRTLILEEHGSIGKPDHCAGLISIDGLHRLGVAPSKGIVLNKVRGATVFSPSGARLTVERQMDQAYVVDRVLLDRQIIDEAVRAGSSLALNARASLLDIGQKAAIITVDMREAKGSRKTTKTRSDLVASCEGALPRLSKQVGLDTPNPRMRLYATQFEMSKVNLERDDIVQIHLGRNYALGFFAWVIPTGPDSARVGLASKEPRTMPCLRYFISRHRPSSEMFMKAKMDRSYGGFVLTGGPVRRNYSERFLSIGDCAGQTKPTTGGGVVTGGMCAKIGVDVMAKSAEAAEFGRKFLSRYQKICRRELGQELFTMLRMRHILNSLPDGLIDRLINGASRTGLANLIEKRGDVDKQSNLIKGAFASPKIIVGALLSMLGII